MRVGPDGHIPLYDDLVTLQRDDRVIHHLVQLLGTDESLFFVVHKDPGLKRPVGAMMIHFGSIEKQ
jgi:hypothetical protein